MEGDTLHKFGIQDGIDLNILYKTKKKKTTSSPFHHICKKDMYECAPKINILCRLNNTLNHFMYFHHFSTYVKYNCKCNRYTFIVI